MISEAVNITYFMRFVLHSGLTFALMWNRVKFLYNFEQSTSVINFLSEENSNTF